MPGKGVLWVYAGSQSQENGRLKITGKIVKALMVPDKQLLSFEFQKAPDDPQPPGAANYLAWIQGGRPSAITSEDMGKKVLGQLFVKDLIAGALAQYSAPAATAAQARAAAAAPASRTTVGADGRVTTEFRAGRL